MALTLVLLSTALLLSVVPVPACAAPYAAAGDPHADHTAAAKSLDAAGEDDAALAAFRAAVRFHPRSHARAQNLAVFQQSLGELGEAREGFARALRLALDQGKPRAARRVRRRLLALRREWLEAYDEHMDEVAHEHDPMAGGSGKPEPLRFQQRPAEVPLHRLAERKYLDRETSGRGPDRDGFEDRLTAAAISTMPPHEILLQDCSGGGPGQDVLLDYMGSAAFQKHYWEQWPLRIQAPGCVDWLVRLEELLADPLGYRYGGEKTKHPHRNVNYLQRRFTNRDTQVAKGTVQREHELLGAMRRNYTLQFLGTHYWIPNIANMSFWLSQATGRPISVNLYVTPPGQHTSLVPHSDFQCALMMQMSGRKRWRLWKMPGAWLPVRYRHIHGRDDGDEVLLEWLGEPLMDVVLEKGDVLYVPRGCIHLTSTVLLPSVEDDGRLRPLREKPSVHLTVGMEALWDSGVSTTWEAFFGAGEFYQHQHVTEAYYRALGNLIDKDSRFRETMPMSFLHAGPKFVVTDNGASWSGGNVEEEDEEEEDEEARAFVQMAKDRMHAIVDEMFAATPMVQRVRRMLAQTKHRHNQQLAAINARSRFDGHSAREPYEQTGGGPRGEAGAAT